MIDDSAPDYPRHRHILAMAWPVVVAGVSTPLLGLVDTAVIGQTRPASALGAIAIGSLALTFMYWAFGFLRMSTTGFVAQAQGAGNSLEVRTASLRAIALGGALGIAICALQVPIAAVALPLLGASGDLSELAGTYIVIRIWAAPATLMLYAVSGMFIGLGQTRLLLKTQLLLNGLNIVLDVLLAGVLDMGVRGIAIGTLIAEWAAAIWGLWLAYRLLQKHHSDSGPLLPWHALRQRSAWRDTMTANGNIMIRTLALLAGMVWFTRQGALLGEVTLAANHVLIGFVSFCAFFMDGVAFSTESLVGAAKGARDLPKFDRIVRRSSEIALVLGLLLAAILYLAGDWLIRLITDIPSVVIAAEAMLPLTAGYIALSIAAFQLDGIFIGTTCTREMRNAAIISASLFIASSAVLIGPWGQTGLWISMLVWTSLRGITLLIYLPALRRDVPIARS